ncbi:MAG: metal ABC transporter permease [Fusobacterium sp. JB021]|nr:metal ABC transporter permease [Fusobacterium sp. JB021]MDP0506434.1 metal ABC transporter permease [Fusobacterium sp. JB019]MDP0506609.1 metal ABC transporter permease [Fusobacterium sp. JB019]
MNFEILMILIITSFSCSLIGVFISLRKMAMLMDAISHTALIGVVLAYLIIRDINSPFLIIGASAVCVLTVYLIEVLSDKKIEKGAATGLIFPLLFSLGVLIIDRKLKNSQISINSALFGKLEFIIFKRLTINNIDLGPLALYIMLVIAVVIAVFIIIFYKELKVISFDIIFAKTSGVSVLLVHYLFISLISLTAVSAFNIVGVILVISLIIGPSITSLLFTKNLKKTIIFSIFIGLINSLVGYGIAFKYDIIISGAVASVNMIVFLLALLFIGGINEYNRRKLS